MQRVLSTFRTFDEKLTDYIQENGIGLLRISIGLIYLIFGFLKFLPNYSPAEELAAQTIGLITLGVFSGKIALYSLAIIECGIGALLMAHVQTRWIIRIALWHMVCTFFPLIILPETAFTHDPYSLSLVGQYILKNLIIICALLIVYTSEKRS